MSERRGDDDPERWIPVPDGPARHGDKPGGSPPSGARPGEGHTAATGPGAHERPEDVLRRFFEMQRIPPDAEVVVAPNMRAAMDVPLKVAFVLLLLFGPFTATGFLVDHPFLEDEGPLWWIYAVYQFWPLLIFVFAPAVRLRFTRYVVDAEGIRSRTQLLSINESRVSWDKVTAISYRRTLFDRVMGLERMNVIAYGEHGATLRLVGLTNGRELRDLTAQKMREHATAESIFSSD